MPILHQQPGSQSASSLGRITARHFQITCLCLVLLLSLPCGTSDAADSATVPAGFSDRDVGGVRLLLKTQDTPGLASIFAVMLVGAGNQTPDETHCAHVAEHMVFRNPLPNGSTLGQAVSNADGIYNGWSGHYHTQFELSVPDERIPEALGWLVEALFPTSLARFPFGQEIHRMVGELTYMTTNHVGAPVNAFRQQVFQGTPYAERLFEVPITDVTLDAVTAFMAREYSPERLIIVVVSGVDEDTVAHELASALDPVPRGQPPEWRQVSPSPPSLAHFTLKGFGRPQIILGLIIDGIEEVHRWPLDVGLYLLRSRLASTTPQGLDLQTVEVLPMEGARCLLVTFAAKARISGDRLERLTDDAAQALRIAVAEGPDLGQLPEILEAMRWTVDPEHLPPGVPLSLMEAYRAGMAMVPWMPASFTGPLDDIEEHEIAAVFRHYVPSARYTTLVVTGTGGLAPAAVAGASMLAASGIVLALILARRRRRSSKVSPR